MFSCCCEKKLDEPAEEEAQVVSEYVVQELGSQLYETAAQIICSEINVGGAWAVWGMTSFAPPTP